MQNRALRHLRSFLAAAIVFGASASTATAQQQDGFFVEPDARSVWLLDEPALVVGLRLGSARSHGFGFDLGFDSLIGSASRNPGPFAGDAIRRLGRLSLALRYGGEFTERFRFDLGGSVAAGFADAEVCGGTDVCAGTSGYLGAGPEAGATFLVGEEFGVRLNAGYVWSSPLSELGGPSVGLGVRFWP